MTANDADIWGDADMASVMTYLRSSTLLNVAPPVREALGLNRH